MLSHVLSHVVLGPLSDVTHLTVSHVKALFHEGVKVRYAYESIAGINYVITRHNRYTSYDVYTSPKFWREFNKNY